MVVTSIFVLKNLNNNKKGEKRDMDLAKKLCKRTNFTKSITLELKPVDATAAALKKDNILGYDKFLAEKKEIVCTAMDAFYRNFLNTVAPKICVNWDRFADILVTGIESEISAEEESVKTQIVTQVKAAYDEAYDKSYDASFIHQIFKEWVSLHRDSVENADEVIEAIESVKNAAPIFNNYFTTRKTILEGTGVNSFAERVVSNFEQYNSNIALFKRLILEQKDIISAVNESMNLTCELYSEPETYATMLIQTGIDTYNNTLGGLTDGVNYIKGINQLTNELNQKNKGMDGFRAYKRIPAINKQILAVGTAQYVVDSFENDAECLTAITDNTGTAYETSMDVADLIASLSDYNNNKIGIADRTIAFISLKLFSAPNMLKSRIIEDMKAALLAENEKKKTISKADAAAIDKQYKNRAFSIAYIDELIDKISKTDETPAYRTVGKFFIDYVSKKANEVSRMYDSFDVSTSSILSESVGQIKEMFDGIKEVNNMLKYFSITDKEFDDFDVDFYTTLDSLVDKAREFDKIYNMVRNHITKEPASLARKNATCFGTASVFSNGWTQNNNGLFVKGEQSFLMKDDNYYFAMYSKGADSKISKLAVLKEKPNGEYYSKPVIETLAKAYMNLPKYAFTVGKDKSVKAQFADKNITTACRDENMLNPMFIEREFYEKYVQGWHKKSHIIAKKNTPVEVTEKTTKEYKEYLVELIDFFKEFLLNFVPSSVFNYNFLASDQYADIGDFFNHVDSFWYKISECYIAAEDIDKLVADGILYLFNVTNKEIKKGTFGDSYSKYFNYLLSSENRDNTTVKLNGAPQFFFRPAVIEDGKKIVHKKGSVLVNRTASNGKRIPEDIYLRIYRVKNGMLPEDALTYEERNWLSIAVTKEAAYDIIKDRRYTEDKYGITFSINVNTDVWQRPVSNREVVLNHIRENGTNIMSVVRGEENMLYYVLMNQNGKIIEQKSLNIINGVNYQTKLKGLTGERKASQRNWDNSKKVAAYKEGYLKFAIAEIIKIALKNNAMIAIENINDAFKDRRALIDNQVYKKFETMIVSRLACYSTNDIDVTEPGGVINPMQLVNTNYNGILNGILMNIEPSYTANMCPATGFVNLFDYRNINSTKEIRAFFGRFKSIKFNDITGFFEFSFDFNDFETKKTRKKSDWVITTAGNRTVWNAQDKCYDIVNTTDEIKKIFNGHITENLVDSISELTPAKINRLFDIFKMIISFKVYGDNGSYMISAVKTDKNGLAFDSRDVSDNSLPNCADASKAMRIGQKAIMNLEKALNGESLGLTAEEWLNH